MNEHEIQKIAALLAKHELKEEDYIKIKKDLDGALNDNFKKYEQKYADKIKAYLNGMGELSKLSESEKNTALSAIKDLLDPEDQKGYDRLITFLKFYLLQY